MKRGVHRVRDFQRIWLSNLTQEVGRQVGVLALTVTAVAVLDASAFQVGLLTALGTIAYLLVGLPAGVWVDRWRKRLVLVVSDLVRAAATLSVAIAYLFDVLTIWQLLAVAATISFTSVFSDTAQTALLPSIVAPKNVSEATARLQSTDSTMQVLGPALASALLIRIAAPILYFVTAGMSVVSAAAAGSIRAREPRPVDIKHPPFFKSLFDGLRFIKESPVLRTFMVTNALINAGAGVFATLIVIVALDDWNLSASSYALATGIGATGGIIGSLIGMPIRRKLGAIRAIQVCYCLIPVAAFVLPSGYLLPIPPTVVVAGSSFLFGMIIVVSSISSAGIRAEVSPPAMMGRVTAAHRFFSQGALPLGAILAGTAATLLSNAHALLLSPIITVAASAIFLFSPLRRHRELPDHWKYSEREKLSAVAANNFQSTK